MQITTTTIPDVKVIQASTFIDDRGFFMETWRAAACARKGVGPHFVQDNHSHSRLGVLRGLHYQVRQPQGKLVRAVTGEIFDVAVDLRRSSPTFGKWYGVLLSAENRRQLWVPEGFAHGFLTLSETADVVYKCTSYYSPKDDRTLLWKDEDLGIAWPTISIGEPVLSQKDACAPAFCDAECFD